MSEIGLIFMYMGNEFKIIHKDDKKNRINIEAIGDNYYLPEINDKIEIEKIIFKVIYVHKGKKRISLELVRKGE